MTKWRLIAKEALTQTLTVAKFLCLLHVSDRYLCSPTLVYGPSMLPTLNLTGDVILTEHVSHRLGRVGPGDVVLVRSPLDPLKCVTKRIVAVEGDQVTFLNPRISDTCRTVVVPKGHVWIQGDNMYASKDSRHFGPVPYGLIQGKAFFRGPVLMIPPTSEYEKVFRNFCFSLKSLLCTCREMASACTKIALVWPPGSFGPLS